MTKSPEMVAFLDSFSMSAYGRKRSECLEQKICVCCGEPADHFDDLISRNEYGISALCQKCQDDTFSLDNEE
jgi:hypothetical protein